MWRGMTSCIENCKLVEGIIEKYGIIFKQLDRPV